jgi:hypothetical protein
MSVATRMSGVLYPQWAVGFAEPFKERIGVFFEGEYISHVSGETEDAQLLRDVLIGGRLIEGGVAASIPRPHAIPSTLPAPTLRVRCTSESIWSNPPMTSGAPCPTGRSPPFM